MAWSVAEWATGSTARLMRVPWDPSYKDVLAWTRAERDAYFSAHETAQWTISNMQYLKANEPVMVPLMYDDCWDANYLVVHNADCPTASSTPPTLCYFVTNVAYVNPETSSLELQLDVWNTFALEMGTPYGYLERGHLAFVAFASYKHVGNGQDVVTPANDAAGAQVDWKAINRFCMEPEGLDVGNEYQVFRHEHIDLTTWVNPQGDGGEIGVVVVSSVELQGEWGSESAPNVRTPGCHKIGGTITNLSTYYFTIDGWEQLTRDLTDAPWISKGISNVYVVPRSFLNLAGSPATFGPDNVEGWQVMGGSDATTPLYDELVRDLMDTAWFEQFYDSVPYPLYKCYTYPYSYIMIDTNVGNPLVLKPELLANGELQLRLRAAFEPPTTKIGILPVGYGLASDTIEVGNIYSYLDTQNAPKQAQAATGYGYQTAAWLDSMPQTQVVNDEYNYYLASTYNSRNASYTGAGWLQSKSLASSGLSYNQSLTNMANQRATNELRNQQVQNSILAGLGSGAVGAIGSLATGNFLGAASTVVNQLIGSSVQMANNDLTNQQFYSNQATALTLAGQNKGLAQWAARGDYAQAIRSLDASVQDAAITQPSVSGMAAGDTFNLDWGLVGFDVYVMVPSFGRRLALVDYFERYGYTVNRFIRSFPWAHMCDMSEYQYWKMEDCTIVDMAGDDNARDVVKGIFERGVTVWKNPDHIGQVGMNGVTNVPEVTNEHYWWY